MNTLTVTVENLVVLSFAIARALLTQLVDSYELREQVFRHIPNLWVKDNIHIASRYGATNAKGDNVSKEKLHTLDRGMFLRMIGEYEAAYLVWHNAEQIKRAEKSQAKDRAINPQANTVSNDPVIASQDLGSVRNSVQTLLASRPRSGVNSDHEIWLRKVTDQFGAKGLIAIADRFSTDGEKFRRAYGKALKAFNLSADEARSQFDNWQKSLVTGSSVRPSGIVASSTPAPSTPAPSTPAPSTPAPSTPAIEGIDPDDLKLLKLLKLAKASGIL